MRHLAVIPFCLPQDINKDFLRFGKVKQSNIHKTIRGSPGGSDGKETVCNAGDPGLIPGGRSPAVENGNLLGSSPGGSREFEAGTASARIRKQPLN